MRIISKYKDFYDFIAQDHDADVTYVRKPFLVYENYDKLYTKGLEKKYVSLDPLWFSGQKNSARMSNFVFGIYPYVYSQPVLHIMLETNTKNVNRFDYVFTKTEVEELIGIKKNDDLSKHIEKIANREGINIAKKHSYLEIPRSIKLSWMYEFNEYHWKVECPEIFMKIGAPVFVKDNGFYVDYSQFGMECERGKKIFYIANFWFTKLSENMIKSWFDELMDLNTYINIENFLWASKKEPESLPDNNTKIINHGFDLKTSFRKM